VCTPWLLEAPGDIWFREDARASLCGLLLPTCYSPLQQQSGCRRRTRARQLVQFGPAVLSRTVRSRGPGVLAHRCDGSWVRSPLSQSTRIAVSPPW
jgi:hypothetical protein